MLNTYTHSASTIAIIIAVLLILFLLYKLYKKCTNKTTCCGMIPNLCIRVNQSVDSIPSNLNKHVVRYNRNTAQTSMDTDDLSEEETVKINPIHYNQPIGYIPARRPLSKVKK